MNKDITDEKVKILINIGECMSLEDRMHYIDLAISKNERFLRNFLDKEKVKNNPYKNGTIGNGFTFPEEDFYNEIIKFLKEKKLSVVEKYYK